MLCLVGKALIIQLNICTAKAIVFVAKKFLFRKLFTDLCDGKLYHSIARPTRNGERLFLLFDLHITSTTSLKEAKCTFRSPLLIALLSFHT